MKKAVLCFLCVLLMAVGSLSVVTVSAASGGIGSVLLSKLNQTTPTDATAIKNLQIILTTFGNYRGNYTGKWDAATKNAVIYFQGRNSLATDGIVGPKTLTALVQACLKEFYKSGVKGAIDPGAIDGVWGTNTSNAVYAFQCFANLSPDRVVGDATWAALGKVFSSQ